MALPSPPNPRGVAFLLADSSTSVLCGERHRADRRDLLERDHRHGATADAVQRDAQCDLVVAGDAKVLRQDVRSDNQPLQRPPILDQFQFLPTNEIPASFTQGTATSMSDVFVGDWRQLIIGQRRGFTVQTLVERYAELGKSASSLTGEAMLH